MAPEEVNVLVVDDVQTIRVQVQDLLMNFGFRNIFMVEEGQAAIALLKSGKFHLILCDWHMNPPDGMDILRFVRSDPKLKGIAFIMMTAEQTRDKVLEAVTQGVDDYLLKPITYDQVRIKVHAVLSRKGVLK